MTANQTIDGVPREQVERALDAIEQVGLQDKFIDYAFVRTVKQELRALLGAPVHPCPVQLDGCDGSCAPAVQLQGEPVAWIKPDVAKTLTKGQCCYAFGSQNPKGTLIPLYAEQPAPVAVVHPFTQKVIRKLERFQECTDDGQGADIGRHWFDLLTQLGLLNRVQRSPALWEMTQQGEDALELSRKNAKSR